MRRVRCAAVIVRGFSSRKLKSSLISRETNGSPDWDGPIADSFRVEEPLSI
jgi:hypothetical protein